MKNRRMTGYEAAARARRALNEECYIGPPRSNAPWLLVGLLSMIVILGALLAHYRPDLPSLPAETGSAPPASAPRPTFTASQRNTAQQNAGATAAEQQALRNAIPTEDASAPPVEPTAAANIAANSGGVPTNIPSTSFSPTDLGNRPAPTPTTMLTQEQFAASQASEEQNQLNTQLSGLTPAQQLVVVHDAEYQASNP